MRECLHQAQTPPAPMHHSKSSSPDLTPTCCSATYFEQPCPACGRRLLILVERLGEQVSCSHCCRAFVARDVSQDRRDGPGAGRSSLEWAEWLLSLLELTPRTY
jgi:hypothetical protein